MRIVKDSRGREIITTGDAPRTWKGGEEIITTANVEEIKLRRKKEKEAAKAKGHPSHAPAADSEKSIASKRAKAKDSVKSEPGKKGKE